MNKITPILLLILFSFGFLQAQNQDNTSRNQRFRAGYGAAYSPDSKGIGYNLFLDGKILQSKSWSLLGEVSYFSGNRGFKSYPKQYDGLVNFFALELNESVEVTRDPAHVSNLNWGLKANLRFLEKGRYSLDYALGVLLSHRNITTVRERLTRIPSVGNFTITAGSLISREVLEETMSKDVRITVPIQLAFTTTFKRMGFSVIPAYYFAWKKVGNPALYLTMNF